MEEKDDINKPPRESDGLNVVSAQKHWKNIASQLKINLRQEMELKLNLANTVFSTGSIITLFYFGNGLNLGQHLCDLEILLPRGLIPRHSSAVVKTTGPICILELALRSPIVWATCLNLLITTLQPNTLRRTKIDEHWI